MFDGLRAIAALGVLVGHCATAATNPTTLWGHTAADMQMGVTIFFVISGFLLYRPFVAADMEDRRAAPIGVFYLRRALRIFPAYWVALTLIGILPGVIGALGDDGWWHYYLLIQNYFGLNEVFSRGIGPAWSLSIEIAFYLCLPLFALGMRKLAGDDPGRRVVRDLIVLLALAVASTIVRHDLVTDLQQEGFAAPTSTFVLLFSLPLFLTWFAFGMAFASVSAWSLRTGNVPAALKRASEHPGLVWLAALAGYAVMVVTTPGLNEGEHPAHHVLTVLIAAAVVFPAAFPHPDGEGVPHRVLTFPAVAWVGLISYGFYLWSVPILTALVTEGYVKGAWPFLTITVLSVALSLVAGALSYYIVERPFLRLKNLRRGREPAPASVERIG